MGTRIFTEAESLALFSKAREIALKHQSYRMPVYQLGLDKDDATLLVARWMKLGYICQAGSPIFSDLRLAERYRSYMPGEDRNMSEDEQKLYVAEVRDNTASDGKIRVNSLSSKEGLWRLVDAGIVSLTRHAAGSHVYYLREAI